MMVSIITLPKNVTKFFHFGPLLTLAKFLATPVITILVLNNVHILSCNEHYY